MTAMPASHTLSIGFLICTLIGVLIAHDFELHRRATAKYCHGVGLWQTDEFLGVPEEKRRGAPERPDKKYRDLCRTERERLNDDLIEYWKRQKASVGG